MPTTVQNIVDKYGLVVQETIPWGTASSVEESGLYIISSSMNLRYLPDTSQECPGFRDDQIALWRNNAPEMLLNNKVPTDQDLKKQLSGFWLSDESIVYIGKSEKSTIKTRLGQYYGQKVGKRSPHKGGYWLKLLNGYDKFWVHVIQPSIAYKYENDILQYFIGNVSVQSRSGCIDQVLTLPFANLQQRPGIIKKHLLTKHYQ